MMRTVQYGIYDIAKNEVVMKTEDKKIAVVIVGKINSKHAQKKVKVVKLETTIKEV